MQIDPMDHGKYRVNWERTERRRKAELQQANAKLAAEAELRAAAAQEKIAATQAEAARVSAAAGVKAREAAALVAETEEARLAAEHAAQSTRRREQSQASMRQAMEQEAAAEADGKEQARALAAAKAARKQANKDRAEKAEEERLAGVERETALVAEGRKKIAGDRYLSDDAARQGTHNRRPGQRAKKNRKKAEQKALAAQQEAITVQQAQLAAERLAFEKQQRREGVQLSGVQQARAATAAIEDPQARKRHARLVDSAERYVSQLAAVTQDPVHLRQRISGAVSAVVTDAKKISKDDRQRTVQERRAAQRRGDTAAQNDQWKQRHLGNPRPQDKWSKLSRKHSVAKTKQRHGQKNKQAEQAGRRQKHHRHRP
jgi:hypothetical protein